MNKGNWTKIKLREVAELNPYKIDKNFQFKEIEYFDISLVGTGYIEKPKIIEFKEASSRAKRLVGEENIILSTVRPNRRSFYYFKQVKKNYVVSTGFAVIKAKEKIFPRFLYYLVSDINFTNYLTKNAKGSAYPAVDEEIINDAIFCIPQDVKEQQKIAAVLSAYDELIEINNRRIEILEEMAEIIYKEWFVHFRYPGYEKDKMVNSELGKIPEGWKIKKLSETVKSQYGYTESASDRIIGPKFLRGKDINKNSYIIWSDVPYCKIEENIYEKFRLKKGDIIVVRMADPGKVGIVEKDIDSVFASYLIRLKINSDYINPYYLFYYMLSNKYQSYIYGASSGTTRKSASAKIVTNASFVLPPKKLMDQFEKYIKTLRVFLNTLLETNENLKETRDMLLPKLISGKIDVSDLDIKVEEKK